MSQHTEINVSNVFEGSISPKFQADSISQPQGYKYEAAQSTNIVQYTWLPGGGTVTQV